jgi:HK97 family phage major capsid protein
MAKSLVDLLTEKQDAERRELDELTSLAVEDFTEEKEARASVLSASIRSRETELKNAQETEARAAAAAEAAALEGGREERGDGRSPAKVTKEERTYTPEKSSRGETSFFSDAYNATNRGDMNARERLNRHAREVQVEGEVSQRATTTASFAGLVVPQYLVEQAALVARAGRVFANTVQGLTLPDQGMVFYIPKGTTGAATAIQATQNTSVQNTDQVWADVQINVQTIAGQQDISRQSLERGTPGIDSLVYLDLAGAYAVNVDAQCITGSGTGTKGIQNSGGAQATAFTAAATVATFYTKLAGAVNSVQTNRFMAPTAILMHPRRWNWLVGQTDSSTRPLVVPGYAGPTNAVGVPSGGPQDTNASTPVGFIQGLPVYVDANVPTAVGTASEDLVFVYRQADFLLWEEGDGLPRQLRFEETLGNQLTVKLVVYGYIAFTGERYPTASAIIGGNAGAGFGLVAPTF